MIEVENDYESVTYEQPFHSQIYENHLELFLNYHTRTKSKNIPIEEIVNEVTTSQQPENEQTHCSITNHIKQNTPKEPPKEKIWTVPFLLESPKCKDFQPPDLEIDFSIDSGAESNIIIIPTWNEIKILHPRTTPIKTTSRLLNKPFKQIFHITDIKHNNIGIPFITKYIPTIFILDSKINIKDKNTRMQNTALTFFQRMNKQPPFTILSKILPHL